MEYIDTPGIVNTICLSGCAASKPAGVHSVPRHAAVGLHSVNGRVVVLAKHRAQGAFDVGHGILYSCKAGGQDTEFHMRCIIQSCAPKRRLLCEEAAFAPARWWWGRGVFGVP